MNARCLAAAFVGAAAAVGASVVPATADWTTYHFDNTHDGIDASAPAFASVAPNWTTVGGAIDGDILSEPLYSAGVVYVVTMNNTLYALDPSDGHTLWSKHLENPCPASLTACVASGDSIPSAAVGIMSTPVIDPVANVLYAVGMNSSSAYHLWAVDLSTHGLVYPPVDVSPPFDPGQHSTQAEQNAAQNQRGALALSSGGMLYIPYGGRAGDCCGYHGYVIGVKASDGTGFISYHTPFDPSNEAGMWSSGGVAIDSSGNVFASTGNGSSTDPASYDYGNSVLKLSPTLALLSSWAPSDWASLSSTDTDIGSTGPTLIGTGLVFQSGKNGKGYLLNQSALGGIGGEIVSHQVCSAESKGANAFASGYVYMPCDDGLYALKLSGSGSTSDFSTAWTLPGITAGPPIVAGGAVWVIDTSTPTLYALNPTTGAQVASLPIAGSVEHFITPSEGGGNIYVPGSGFVEAFSVGTWKASYDMTQAPTSWVAGESQTFPVTVTNTGSSTWPSTGYTKVDLDLHVSTQAGGSAKLAYWLKSQAFSLPADVAPNASVTLNVSFVPPTQTGSLVLEAEMIKEHEFWFQQWQSVSITVAPAVWKAAYNLAGVPYTWHHGRSQNITVILYNLGNITWPRSGTYRVALNIHFTTVPGGYSRHAYWLTSVTYSLPHSLVPGGSFTMTVSVLAPTTMGRMYIETEMIKVHQFWFKQAAATRIIVR